MAWLAAHEPAAVGNPSLIAATTPKTLADFANHELARGLKASSIATAIGNAIGVARAIGPEPPPEHLRALWTVVEGLEGRATRERRSPREIARPEDLYLAGFAEMDAALGPDGRIADANRYQAGLMVALLAAAPVRIGNFASLELGRDLRLSEGGWHIRLDAERTKTRRRDIWPVPEGLRGDLEYFLEEGRPVMLTRARRPAGHARLWVGAVGQPLEHQGVRQRIKEVTERQLGRAISPHSFRHSAATAFVVDHPERPREAAALLGHAGFRTTERHYVRSSRQLSIRQMQAFLERFRRQRDQEEADPHPDDLPR
ncbi:tyrosine-type recombinase/integrase [Falsiroseomonas oryziterrae]|uniref:tyrosine-type recombinase/integrase n=1 Tax=Falsiroseomonas oryziterrae TaxID=2911368 RepID=UPI001F46E19C|nr:tyrosine-type recombinase/integrase [Roseomonas sp. NPKOSM-4]